MIFDRLKNCEKYYILDDRLKKGFEFLKKTDLKTLADGRYEIDKDRVFANVQTLTTKKKELKKWEAHRSYLDIQYLIKGSECMGFGITSDFKKVIEPYNAEKDIEFLDGGDFNYINLKEGDFVIFYPDDTHAPMLSVENDIEIKKVIVKVLL